MMFCLDSGINVYETAKGEEKPVSTFKLAGKRMNLAAIKITVIILVSLALGYALLRIARAKGARKRK